MQIVSEELHVIDQGELLQTPNPEELTQKLQAELEFKPDETGEWLINDDLEDTSGLTVYEWLPTITRVSSNGTRLEFGVRKEDLEKTLELARIAGEDAQNLDYFRSFWPDGTRLAIVEDEEWLFMGAEIEPTPHGFESYYQGIHLGLVVALTASTNGMSYEEMKADDWFSGWVKSAETKPEDGGRLVLFPKKHEEIEEEVEEEINEESDAEDESTDDNWDRQAPNLRSYHINSYKKSIIDAPTKLQINGKLIEGNNGWLIGHNGEDIVSISDSWHEPREGSKEQDWNWYKVKLSIPEGIEIATVDDMSKLTSVSLEIRYDGTNEPVITEYPVQVTVEDHAVRIESEDGEFAFEIQEPACAECHTPIWQFREPTDEEWGKEDEYGTSEIVMPVGMSRGNGVYHFTLNDDRNKIYCYDDCMKLQEQFAQEHPVARRRNAEAAVRQRLDAEGYDDVQLMPQYTHPIWPGRGDGLELFAYIEYERNGRKITRRVGRPQVSYDGQVTLKDLPSREYVELR